MRITYIEYGNILIFLSHDFTEQVLESPDKPGYVRTVYVNRLITLTVTNGEAHIYNST